MHKTVARFLRNNLYDRAGKIPRDLHNLKSGWRIKFSLSFLRNAGDNNDRRDKNNPRDNISPRIVTNNKMSLESHVKLVLITF